MTSNQTCSFLLILALSWMAFSCSSGNPQIVMNTDLGDITIVLFEDKAPVTVANFLRYVDEGRFDGSRFYRVVHPGNQPGDSILIEVIQGGLMDQDPDRTLPPIDHETTDRTGLRHSDGVISMARWKPGTATSEFFICIGDQPELDFGGKRNPDGQGFAAFGRVVDGMDVVRNIQQLPEKQQMLDTPVLIKSMKRNY